MRDIAGGASHAGRDDGETPKRLLADEPSPPSHHIDVAGTLWETSKFPGIERKLLYGDPNTGMATLLFRLAPGVMVPLHEHTGVELTYVLEGSLEDEETVCTIGNFVCRPPATHLRRGRFTERSCWTFS